LSLTPSVVYNIIPWTWLIDYFTNLGDVFDAISSGVEERFIADYFYVMREVSYTDYHQCSFDVYTNWTASSTERIDCTWETTVTQKHRTVASPFGFGLTDDSLSPLQLGILGALGLSRLPFR
jgi:hypothetical protein